MRQHINFPPHRHSISNSCPFSLVNTKLSVSYLLHFITQIGSSSDNWSIESIKMTMTMGNEILFMGPEIVSGPTLQHLGMRPCSLPAVCWWQCNNLHSSLFLSQHSRGFYWQGRPGKDDPRTGEKWFDKKVRQRERQPGEGWGPEWCQVHYRWWCFYLDYNNQTINTLTLIPPSSPPHRKHNRIQVNPQLSQQTRNPALNYKVFSCRKT